MLLRSLKILWLSSLLLLEVGYAQKVIVPFYELFIDVHPSTKTIGGKLSFVSNIDSTTTQKLLQEFKKNSGFECSLDHSSEDKITITFSGTPLEAQNPPWDGGFIWKTDENNLPFIGVACQEEGPQIWWPAFDAIAVRPDSMLIHLTVPDNLLGISNGKLINLTENDTTTTFHWKVSYPINNYNVSIYVGDYTLVKDLYITQDQDTLELNYYPLSYNVPLVTTHFAQVKKMLAVYEELFGAYPFMRNGYKLVEAPYWGMEHQSAIAYGNHYQNNAFGFDFIILHESAHEYWGNSITMSDFKDLWIHEAMATYTEVLFIEKTQGKEQALAYLEKQKTYIKNTSPIAGTPGQKKYGSSDMYFKGSWMMHTLRNQYFAEDSVWFKAIKRFYQKFKGKFIDRNDFITYWENRSGNNLNDFFDQYLFQETIPTLHYKIKGKKLTYYWEQDQKYFPQITVMLNGRSFDLRPTSEIQVYKAAQKIDSVVFPTTKLLIQTEKVP